MKIGIPKQIEPGETRVAATPASVKKLVGMGVQVMVEHDAGRAAQQLDADYEKAGATIVDNADAIWADSDMVLTIHCPAAETVGKMKDGSAIIGMLAPLAHTDVMQQFAAKKVHAMSLEFIPRISRAQPMDVLSSQANLGGYKAVLLAANECPKIFPMMMTAAGTVAPARVLVIGIGVAGLQAIATAKRLGAVVEAYDVRSETKEQAQSLGARFIELPTAKQEGAATGGYAKEQTDDDRKKQAELMAKHVIGADAVITTAAVFGKAPPMLVPADVVRQMAPGSVIVDMAADHRAGRGNCELTKPGQTITTENGTIIVGVTNLPATLPVHSSQVYANNMVSLVAELVKDGAMKVDLTDDIQKGATITHDGQITNELVKKAIAG